MLSEKQFENFDYIIFSLMLSISSGIGIFFGCFRKKQQTTKDLLVADREMGSLPVSISLFASYISSASVFGGPLEAYNHGIMFIWCVLGYRICTFITSKIFIPLFVELGYTSAYEYLEKRFDKKVKLLATLIFILHTVLYLSFVLYSPAYAINGVTRMNTWVLVVTIGIVSTFYTTIGGMVTVMWTDVFQVTVIFFGLICIATLGLKEAGGLERVIEINWIYKRLNLFNFKLNLMERHTVWSLTLGYSIQWLSIYSVNQSQVQRYLSSKSLKVAKRAVSINFCLYWILISISLLIGMIIFASYNGCNLLLKEELLPEYVMEKLGNVPGIPGVFLATIFAAVLSSISSGLNSLATVTLEDFVKSWFDANLIDRKCVQIARFFCILYGVLITSLTCIPHFLANSLQAVLSLFSVTCGPILGMFILGLFVPFANSNGALYGGISSLLFSIYLFIGFYMFDNTVQKNIFNQSLSCGYNSTNITTKINKTPFPNSISYEWYGLIAVSITFIVGCLISLATKPNKIDQIDKKYINESLLRWYSKLFENIKKIRSKFSLTE